MSDAREESMGAVAELDGAGSDGHPDHIHGQDDHHVLPLGLYLKVYGALLVLTYLTVHVSYMSLGTLSLPAAMAVALVKAGLVVGFFMHLKYDTRFNSFIFFGSILFIVVFFGFTMMDLATRGAVNAESETFAYEAEARSVSDARSAEELLGSGPIEGDVDQVVDEAVEPGTDH